MTLIVKPMARSDILQQMVYLSDGGGAELGQRFIDATERSFARLVDYPNSGQPKSFANPGLSGLRSWPIEGFEDIRAYYLPAPDLVTVLRVLHGRRDIAGVFDDR